MSLFYLNKVCTPYICYESLSVSWAAPGADSIMWRLELYINVTMTTRLSITSTLQWTLVPTGDPESDSFPEHLIRV